MSRLSIFTEGAITTASSKISVCLNNVKYALIPESRNARAETTSAIVLFTLLGVVNSGIEWGQLYQPHPDDGRAHMRLPAGSSFACRKKKVRKQLLSSPRPTSGATAAAHKTADSSHRDNAELRSSAAAYVWSSLPTV